MRKFEQLERRDAPAVLVVKPISSPVVPEIELGGDPPYGKWYNDLIELRDGKSDQLGSSDTTYGYVGSGTVGGQTGSGGNTQATDQEFAGYDERDLNTDGKVDLTDFAFLKATMNGETITA